MDKIKVIIADNHPAFREGLCRLLKDENELEVVGQASDGEEVIELSRTVQPDVAIVDVAMPKLSGIEAIKGIKEVSPKTAVLMLSAFNYQTYVLSALRSGASGYLTKETPIDELKAAIRLAFAGQGIIDRSVANNMIRHLISEKDGKNADTTIYPREIEVLKLAARGMRNKEIAKDLNISERTVQAHLGNIFNKLDVDSRTEAVLRGLKEGWLEICDLS